MKKCLLSLAMSLLLGSSFASAEAVKFPFPVEKASAAQSRAATDDGYQLRFCDELYNWSRFTDQSNITYKCYIEITPEVATSLAGNALTDISFSVAMASGSSKSGTVFVSEDLEGDPVISEDVTITNGFVNDRAITQTVALETPYIIKEGVGFAFGYTVTKCTSVIYPVGYDGMAPTPFAGACDLYTGTGTYIGTISMADDMGTNLYLYASTVGEKKGLEDVYMVNALSMGDFTLPVVDASSGAAGVYCVINNLGSNPVSSVAYSYSLDGADTVTGTLDAEIAPESEGYVIIPVEIANPVRGNVNVSVTSINGNEYAASAELSFIAIEGEGYDRRFVVEEGTGTGCGFCPRGIVGLETMAKNYPDKFIGIAVHCDWVGTDPMTVQSYQPFLEKYFTGLPTCIINRDPIFNLDPSFENLKYCYEYWSSQVAAADVDIKVLKPEEKASNMSVETSTVFAFDDDAANYALAFVIIEDGIKGLQSNNYAGGKYGPLDGWESKASRVAWTYSDTARDIFGVWGIDGSIPSSVEKGSAYTYDYELDMSHVKNVEKTSVIALVLDITTGTILNAKKVGYADYSDPEGVSDVVAEADAPVEYYNIQGMRMDGGNLPAGLYIIRQGDKVQKSIIR